MHFPAIELSEEGKAAPTKKVQLLRVGTFLNGDSKLFITQDMLKTFKTNFDKKVRGYSDGKLPIDYFHENDKVAAGWIENVDLSSDNNILYVDVSWTKSAAQKLMDSELRYISAEFSMDYKDNESGNPHGPTLFGAGLTNRPFVKGMEAVAASESNESTGGTMNLEQALAEIEALKLKSEAAETQLSETNKKLVDSEAKQEADKKLAEKRDSFTKLMAEGKAVEAQRDAFMAGDMVKFSELAKPTNSGVGHSDSAAGEKKPSDEVEGATAQEKILKLAEAARKEDKNLTVKASISQILQANKELAEGYKKEVSLVG